MIQRCVNRFSLLRLSIMLLCISIPPTLSNTHNNTNTVTTPTVDEHRCRACLELGTLFTEYYLPLVRQKYNNNNNNNNNTEEEIIRIESAEKVKRQILVEVHDTVSSLCTTLERIHRKENENQSNSNKNNTTERKGAKGFTAAQKGVQKECKDVLETLKEDFILNGENTLWRQLFNTNNTTSSLEEEVHTNTSNDNSDKNKETQSRQLWLEKRAIGKYCLSAVLCDRYLHHHLLTINHHHNHNDKNKEGEPSLENYSPGGFDSTSTETLVERMRREALKAAQQNNNSNNGTNENEVNLSETLLKEYNEKTSLFYYLFRWETYKDLFSPSHPKSKTTEEKKRKNGEVEEEATAGEEPYRSARDVVLENIFNLLFWSLMIKFILFDDTFWFHFGSVFKYIYLPIVLGSVLLLGGIAYLASRWGGTASDHNNNNNNNNNNNKEKVFEEEAFLYNHFRREKNVKSVKVEKMKESDKVK